MCCSNIFINHSRFRLKQSICKVRESMSQDPGIVKLLYFTTPHPCHCTLRSERDSHGHFAKSFPFPQVGSRFPGSCRHLTMNMGPGICSLPCYFSVLSTTWCGLFSSDIFTSLYSFSYSFIFKLSWVSWPLFSRVSGPPCASAFSLCWDTHLTG